MDLEKALERARGGAEIACGLMMRHYRGDYAVYTKGDAADRAGAVLTEPDLLCDAALLEHFGTLYPDHAVVSEESYGSLAEGWHEREWVWHIDPIDGSLSYLEGSDNFGVSIGLARGGEPVLGVLRNPAQGIEAWAAAGLGAFVNGEPVGFKEPCGEPPRLLLSSNQAGRRSYRRAVEILRPSEIIKLESVVTKAIYLLQGRGDYYFSLPAEVFGGGRPSVWDLAGAAAIVAEAGGAATDIYGEPLHFSGPELAWSSGHLFAHPEAADAALRQLEKLIAERRRL